MKIYPNARQVSQQRKQVNIQIFKHNGKTMPQNEKWHVHKNRQCIFGINGL